MVAYVGIDAVVGARIGLVGPRRTRDLECGSRCWSVVPRIDQRALYRCRSRLVGPYWTGRLPDCHFLVYIVARVSRKT